MKKLFSLMACMLFVCFSSISAQDIQKVDKVSFVKSDLGNVIVHVEVTDQNQKISKQISETKVNEKTGFASVFNEEATVLTLSFSQKFNERELSTLLEYSGVKLNINDFEQLHKLLNQ